MDIEDNLVPKLAYFLTMLGGPVDRLLRNPTYFTLSLARRIVPRHQFLNSCIASSIITRESEGGPPTERRPHRGKPSSATESLAARTGYGPSNPLPLYALLVTDREFISRYALRVRVEMCVHKGELVSGRMGKATLGSGTRTGLFATLLATYEPLVAAGAMDKLARLSSRWIGSRGFSIGLDDVKAPDALIQGRRQRMEAGYARCDAHIEEFRRGNLQLQAGCTMDETLEAVVTGELNNIRQEAGALCSKLLSRLNPAVVMATCGSKGSPLNVAQMVACVGQQTVSGQRCPDGFDGRTLPHYEVGARDPASKGFVANSFFSGLTPTELFFHAMGGREGLVDTAVKTAETGYMSRRLMKALEDLGVQYDGTVRTSTKHIVQFQYGDDGLDPMLMVGKDGVPVDFAEQLASVLEEDRSGAPGETHGVGLDRWADDRDARKSDVEALIASLDNELFPHGLTDQDGKQLDPLGEQGSKGGGKDMRARPSKKFSDELRAFLKSAVVDSRDGLVPSPRQLALLGERSLTLYRAAAVDPGTAVGAVGAQSIGEPGTQVGVQITLQSHKFNSITNPNLIFL